MEEYLSQQDYVTQRKYSIFPAFIQMLPKISCKSLWFYGLTEYGYIFTISPPNIVY